MAERAAPKPSVLYITYDGLLEPLGQSQVLNYLKGLCIDHRMLVMSYEKAADWNDAAARLRTRQIARDCGLTWIALRYHKRPTALATAIDIMAGTVVGSYLVLRYGVRICHARSYVASAIALALKTLYRVRFVFDMRGLWADERVDSGLWPRGGLLYRIAKWFERRFLRSADRIVSLTQFAVEEIKGFPCLTNRSPRFEVITTCTDLDLFRPVDAADAGSARTRSFTLGYVGSVSLWYLFDEALRCFKLLRERIPDARLHILNRGDHAYIRTRVEHHDLPAGSVILEAADAAGVAAAMRTMDAGLFFIKPVYSKIASAPTKLGEFLGCGVPCLGNAGVGDMARILEDNGVGVVLRAFDEASMRDAVARLIELARDREIGRRCRKTAEENFSLREGIRRYSRIYRELMGPSPDRRHAEEERK